MLGDAPMTAPRRRWPATSSRAVGAILVVLLMMVAGPALMDDGGRGDVAPATTGSPVLDSLNVPAFLGGPMLRPDRSHDVPLTWYAVHGSSDRALTLGFVVSDCSAPGEARLVRESPRQVVVTAAVVAGSDGATCAGVGSQVSDTVVLTRPLGDRRVVGVGSATSLPRQRLDRRPADVG